MFTRLLQNCAIAGIAKSARHPLCFTSVARMSVAIYPDLKGKVALVTGGGGAIGSAVCKLFALNEAKVVVADLSEESAKKELPSLLHHSEQNSPHMAVKVDVKNAASVNKMAESILAYYDGVPPQVVVHCVGINVRTGGLLLCTEADWDITMEVNVKGTFLINQKFAGLMLEKGIKGSIVNLSSLAADGLGVAPEYSASKGAINSITKAVAKEMAGHGIRVNALLAGGFGDCQGLSEEALNHLRSAIPVGRIGSLEEAAQLCIFLASEQASYMTCGVYLISGGLIF